MFAITGPGFDLMKNRYRFCSFGQKREGEREGFISISIQLTVVAFEPIVIVIETLSAAARKTAGKSSSSSSLGKQ